MGLGMSEMKGCWGGGLWVGGHVIHGCFGTISSSA